MGYFSLMVFLINNARALVTYYCDYGTIPFANPMILFAVFWINNLKSNTIIFFNIITKSNPFLTCVFSYLL
jgi:hypothetical protein